MPEKTSSTDSSYKRLKLLLKKVRQHNIAEQSDPCGPNYNITLNSMELESLLTDIMADNYLIDSSKCCKKG